MASTSSPKPTTKRYQRSSIPTRTRTSLHRKTALDIRLRSTYPAMRMTSARLFLLIWSKRPSPTPTSATATTRMEAWSRPTPSPRPHQECLAALRKDVDSRRFSIRSPTRPPAPAWTSPRRLLPIGLPLYPPLLGSVHPTRPPI